uniref:hypothetical protein n=1 Tax=Marinomonas gallaica TaxID=1806667 RepID=UPI000A88BC18
WEFETKDSDFETGSAKVAPRKCKVCTTGSSTSEPLYIKKNKEKEIKENDSESVDSQSFNFLGG